TEVAKTQRKSPQNLRNTPLLTTEAVDFLENFLKQKPDANVLEFGSGGSTIWISKLTKNLISIEHDTNWYQKVKNQLQQDETCNSVDLRLLPKPYYTVSEQFPDEFFDLIIVDGRDRVKCVEASIRILKHGGILMLDDAQRKKYKPAHNLLNDGNFQKTISTSGPRHTYWWQKPLSVAPAKTSSPLIITTSAIETSVSRRPYVFAIGLNKCGTTSLDTAFKELGWSTLHGPYKFNQAINRALKKGKKMLHFLSGFNMFCDIFYPVNLHQDNEHSCMIIPKRRQFFEIIDKQYPGSKFICNIRNKKDWLASRKRHVQTNQKSKKYQQNWLKIEEDAWSEEYDTHYNIIFDYFKDRQDFLVINFDETPTYESICQLLQVPIPNKEFPRKNMTKK
ncbi:MAG: sulfotransferase, partial [Microcoleaceae cyanobacterium]